MRSTCIKLLALLLVLSTSRAIATAEPERPSGATNRATWGMVTTATAESVTIAPEVASRKGDPRPAEQTFALSKDKTEFMFAEVGMARMTIVGVMMRTLNAPEPAAAADLQSGQLIQVTPGEGDDAAAKRVIMVWGTRGTLVKVNDDSIVLRPEPPTRSSADAASKKHGAPGAPDAAADKDEQIAISKDATRVRIAEVTDERPAPNGRGVITSISYRDGTIADLKADQAVVVCVRNGAAAKITIHAAKPAK